MQHHYRTVAARLFGHVPDRVQREFEAETSLVRQFFANTLQGVFVDVGANDPVHLSQTWHLESRGWTGIAVEPIAEMCDRLRAERPRTTVVRAACGDPASVGERDFYVADDLDKSTLARNLLDFETAVRRVDRVRVRTLDDVLAEFAPGRVDFVSIDVEGLQLEVIRGFDLRRHRPRLLFVEDHLTDLRTHRLIERQGYRLVKRTTFNNWYVPREATFSLTSPRERFALWQKVYLRTPYRKLRHALRRRAGRDSNKPGAQARGSDVLCPFGVR
jgi:FkbM family methyltransferase